MILEIVFLLLLRKTSCNNVVSAENKNHQEKTDRHTANVDITYRRFNEDVKDEEWHISHLKDADFFEKSECAEETFEEKARKYRRALKNDGALVEYVQAEPLPFNASELLQSNVCTAPNITNLFMVKVNSISEKHTSDASSKSHKAIDIIKANDNTSDPVNTATANPFQNKQFANTTAGGIKRRATEYQFSSIEYYEDIPDFDVRACPEAVEVIELELDMIRKYDVECEMIVEWRSLDN